MATAKPVLTRPPRRYWRKLALVLALVVVLALGWFWRSLHAKAVVATSYGAHVACSCRFIAGRKLEDCRKDFEPGMEPVALSEDAEAKSVTARYLIVSRQTATFKPGQGCVLEPWDN